MLDLKFVRENLDLLRERLAARGMEVDLPPFRALEEERRALILEIEELRARRNAVSKEIAAKKKSGGDAEADVAAMREVGDRIQELEGRQRANDEALARADAPPSRTCRTPRVPRRHREEQNREVRRWGEPPAFDFEPKAHWDLGEALGILDFERAAKISGARFCVSFGPARGWSAR